MDVTDTLAPKSDQLDAVDLLGGPRTFTIEDVTRGNEEQPLQIRLAEFPRVWRPSKGMRRVLASCWGKESSAWIGRRATLYCDPTVRFGPDTVGGTRISHLSHIDGVKKVPEIVSRGKSSMFTVQPLADEPDAPSWPDLIGMATTRAELTQIREQAKSAGVTNGAEIDRLLAARAAQLDDEPAADEPA